MKMESERVRVSQSVSQSERVRVSQSEQMSGCSSSANDRAKIFTKIRIESSNSAHVLRPEFCTNQVLRPEFSEFFAMISSESTISFYTKRTEKL